MYVGTNRIVTYTCTDFCVGLLRQKFGWGAPSIFYNRRIDFVAEFVSYRFVLEYSMALYCC